MPNNTWDERFISLAQLVATWSKDVKKVGAVIVDSKNKVCSLGFNGLPAHMNDDCLEHIESYDKGRVVHHAEQNALYTLDEEHWKKHLTLYVTKPPCKWCSIQIVHSHANIKRLVYVPFEDETFNEKYEVEKSLDFLQENGIQVDMVV